MQLGNCLGRKIIMGKLLHHLVMETFIHSGDPHGTVEGRHHGKVFEFLANVLDDGGACLEKRFLVLGVFKVFRDNRDPAP